MKKLAIFLLIIYSFSVCSKQVPCKKKSVVMDDLIETMSKIDPSSDSYYRDLTTMYMIASVHKVYEICEPLGNTSSQKWGYFKPQDKESRIIFWDGEVQYKSYLMKVMELLKKVHEEYDSLKLGWVYEKLGDLDKAISNYERTFKIASQKVDKEKAMFMNDDLRATLESLKYLQRIYTKKEDKTKVNDLNELIQKYEKKAIVPWKKAT